MGSDSISSNTYRPHGHHPRALVALGAVALLAAGCGSSSTTSTQPSAPAPAPAATGQASSAGSYGGSSAGGPPAAPASVSVATKHSKLGTVLAGPGGRTLYLFRADRGTESRCSGACAQLWPPLVSQGKPAASGAAQAAKLGTTRRPDGTTQITYAGHPLYLYAKDKDAGDSYGQAIKSFGAEWYVLAPAGGAVDRS